MHFYVCLEASECDSVIIFQAWILYADMLLGGIMFMTTIKIDYNLGKDITSL